MVSVDDLLCYNCFDPVTSTGPRGNGTEAASVLLTPDDVAVAFCSRECAEWWFDIIGTEAYRERADVTIGPTYEWGEPFALPAIIGSQPIV